MVEYDMKKFIKILENIKNTYSSLNEMARQSKVTSSYLSKIMASKYKEPPSPKILKNIAENSNNVTSYMDLMQICGYIDSKYIFEHYNKTFSKDNIICALKKSEICNWEDFETQTIDKLYEIIKYLPKYESDKFFNQIDIKYNSTSANTLEEVKFDKIEDNIKIPIIQNFNEEMIVIKNNKIKLNYNEEYVKRFTFFSNEYINKENEYICIKVNDDSMNLKFKKEDIILIQLQKTLEEGGIGFIIVDNKPLIRRYRKQDKYIILESLSNNENYITKIYDTKLNKIKILGKVIAYQGKI